jgi:hypothetical protein
LRREGKSVLTVDEDLENEGGEKVHGYPKEDQREAKVMHILDEL